MSIGSMVVSFSYDYLSPALLAISKEHSSLFIDTVDEVLDFCYDVDWLSGNCDELENLLHKGDLPNATVELGIILIGCLWEHKPFAVWGHPAMKPAIIALDGTRPERSDFFNKANKLYDAYTKEMVRLKNSLGIN